MFNEKAFYDCKINDIDVFQIGKTEKKGGWQINTTAKKNPKSKKAEVYVDSEQIRPLPRKISINFVIYRHESVKESQLEDIFYNKGQCKIVDRSFGVYEKVLVTSHSSVQVEEGAINLLYYSLTGTLVDTAEVLKGIEKDSYDISMLGTAPDSDLANLMNFLRDFKRIMNKIKNFSQINAAINSVDDFMNGAFEFVDGTLDFLYGGLGIIHNANNTMILNANKIKDRADTATGLRDAYVNMPRELEENRGDTLYNLVASFKNMRAAFSGEEEYPERPGIFEPELKEPKSQIEEEEKENQVLVSRFLNSLSWIEELLILFHYNFKTKEELRKHIDLLLKRLSHTGIDSENVSRFREMLLLYEERQDLFQIEEVEIKMPQVVRRIVQERYGNLDYYKDILKLNNIRQDKPFTGTLRLFVA